MTPDFTEDEFHGRLDVKMWLSILRRALRYKRNLFALVTVALASAVGDASFAPLTKFVIDEAVAHGATPRMWGFVAAYLGMIGVLCVFVWMFVYNGGKLSRYLAHDIRRESFDKLQDLPFAYFDARPVGWLMSRITSDCERLAQIIAWGLTDLLWAVCITCLIAGVMFAIHWQLAALVVGVCVPLVFVSRWFHKHLLLASRQIRKSHSIVTAAYNEELMGVRTTKTLTREADNLAELAGLSGELYRHSMRSAILSSIYLPIVTTTGAVAAGLVVWVGGGSVVEQAMTLGTLVMFISFATQFFGPIGQMARILTEMQGAQAAGERVLSLLNTVPEIRDSEEVMERMRGEKGQGPRAQGQEDGTEGSRDRGTKGLLSQPHTPHPTPHTPFAPDGYPHRIDTIEFRDISFAYSNGRPVLQGFNLTVQTGQTIALVGPTGGGKSTIVSLVCRFYEPTHGELLINGIDYRRRSLLWLQSNLGVVLQQPHLFSGTIRDNIRYGRLDATDGEVEEAARLVHAHEFIAQMENGYDTQAGQGGNRLSTGQKQLVSFARAILAEPQVFVMDEATSSIDTHTEHLIQKGLAAVLRGRISFVIAHRLSTIRAADRILFVEGGAIAEQGSHRDLLARRGKYFELYTSHSRMERELHAIEDAM